MADATLPTVTDPRIPDHPNEVNAALERQLQANSDRTPAPTPFSSQFSTQFSSQLSTGADTPIIPRPPTSQPVTTPIAEPIAQPVPVENPVSRPVTSPESKPDTQPTSSIDPAAANAAIRNAKEDISELIQNDNRLIAKFLRLIFHDCVGKKCDGCVNMNNPDNTGVDRAFSVLESNVVPKYSTWLSRADIWMIAALTAAELGQPAGPNRVSFDLDGYGRQGCSASDFRLGPNPKLPSNHLTTQELLDFFSDTFSFTSEQAVAIMGVHST